MLSNDANLLVSLLSNKSDNLGQIQTKFNSCFNFEAQILCFKNVGLLLTNGILDHYQQIVAFWILYKSFEGPKIFQHPFYNIFRSLFDFKQQKPNVCSPELYEILSSCLNDEDLSFLSFLNVKYILSEKYSSSLKTPSNENLPNYTSWNHITPLLIDYVQSDQDTLPQDLVIQKILEDGSFTEEFSPPFLRPIPELTPITELELQQTFISSFSQPPFLYDDNHSIDSRQAALSLLSRSCESELKEIEIESLVNELEKDPSLALDSKLPNEKLLKMIDLNSKVASIAICQIKRTSLFETLTKCEITPGISEVILSLVKCGLINTTFLEQFNKNVMNSVKGLRDNHSITKIVAPFCLLMIKVIKTGFKFEGNLILDLISFCIELEQKNIKEANQLSALLNGD